MRGSIVYCMLAVALAFLLGSMFSARNAMAAPALPATRDGCTNQWMFNGIWRVRVTKVDPLNDDAGKPIGWLVTEQWRNGTDRKFAPGKHFQ